MKDGKQEGKSTGFYENGKIKLERFYSNDVLHGEYIFYNDDGSFAYKNYYEKENPIQKWFQLFKF